MPTDAALADAIRLALAPSGLRERVKLRVAGGWTARQVFERLDEAPRSALLASCAREGGADDQGQEVQRAAVDKVYRALLDLSAAGGAERKQVQYTMTLNTKGPRDMLVDVFRARS